MIFDAQEKGMNMYDGHVICIYLLHVDLKKKLAKIEVGYNRFTPARNPNVVGGVKIRQLKSWEFQG